MDLSYKTYKLLDIANVERANSVYKKGTIYIQVSASPRYGLKQFKILNSEQELKSKYAVVIPKIDISTEYLFIVLTREEQKWRYKYTGNNINIQMDAFKYLEINIHNSVETQKRYIDSMKLIDEEIRMLENTIAKENDVKRFFLKKLFV